MAIPIFLICAFLWFFPIYRRQGKTDRMPVRYLIFAILAGAIPAMIAILALQIPLGWGLEALKLKQTARILMESFASAGLIEELVKFLCAFVIVKIAKPKHCIDYVLLFGGVGLGYEISESIMLIESPLTAIIRGAFAYHILWQFWMGLFYWKLLQAKGNERIGCAFAAFGVPFALHGLNDFCCFLISNATQGLAEGAVLTEVQESAAVFGFVAFVGITLLCVAFNIVTMIECVSNTKAEREAAPVIPA